MNMLSLLTVALASVADIDADGGVSLLQLKRGGEIPSTEEKSLSSAESESFAEEIVHDLGSWLSFGAGESTSDSPAVLAEATPSVAESASDSPAVLSEAPAVPKTTSYLERGAEEADTEEVDALAEEEEDGEEEDGEDDLDMVITPLEVDQPKQLDDIPDKQALAALHVMKERTEEEVDDLQAEAKFAERKAMEAELRATKELMDTMPFGVVPADLAKDADVAGKLDKLGAAGDSGAGSWQAPMARATENVAFVEATPTKGGEPAGEPELGAASGGAPDAEIAEA